MTFKKKTEQASAAATEKEATWKFEDGLTAASTPEHRAQWMAEYKRRQKEVLPKQEVVPALFSASHQ